MWKGSLAMLCAFALVVSATWLTGCGDDTADATSTPVVDAGPDVHFPNDTVVTDVAADAVVPVPDATPPIPDTVTPPPDTTQDSAVGPDGPAPDTTAPEVIATSPAQGEGGVALPFEVTLTFSEPIYAVTLKSGANGSVSMRDHLGVDVPVEISLSADGTVATLKPLPVDDHWVHGSPYEVRLAPGIIADLAGNKLPLPFVLRFFTQGYPDTGLYKGLAQAYAPRFHIDTTGIADVRRRVPTQVNEDGDWDTSNSLTWIAAAPAVYPSVYYNVAESFSHYFIHYMAFFPHVATGTSTDHGNGTVGAMVTVKKGADATSHEPLSVTTYWRTKSHEENDVYATTESGYVGDHASGADWYHVRAVMDAADLFGDDGRYDAYISLGYESCVWNHEETVGVGKTCVVYEALKSTMSTLVFELTDGSPDPVLPNADGMWPSSMDSVEGLDAFGYELISLADVLWPRRLEDAAGEIWGDTYAYSNPGRPADGLVLSSRFVDPVDELTPPYGRPVWAWDFDPQSGPTIGLDRGWLGIDPAHYAMKRHDSSDENHLNIFVPWDAEAGTGFSTDYCFNPLAFIDVRDTEPACAP